MIAIGKEEIEIMGDLQGGGRSERKRARVVWLRILPCLVYAIAAAARLFVRFHRPLINIFGAIRLSLNDFHDIALGLTSGTDTHPSNPMLFGRHTLIYGGSRFRHVNGYWEPNGYLNEAIEK